MRIGFDAKRLVNNTTGLGNYSRTLVGDLARFFPQHEYHLYVPRVKEQKAAAEFLQTPRFVVHRPGLWRAPLWRRWGVTSEIKLNNLDIYHGLSAELPFAIGGCRSKVVVTIHDLIHRFMPRDYPRLDRTVYELKIRSACARADHIVTISACTRRDVMEYHGVPGDKITVVYPSCDKAFFVAASLERRREVLARYELPQDFLLSVGSIIKRKNLLGVIAALRALPPASRIPLVVVGRGGVYANELRQKISAWGLDKYVLFRPGVPFADLPVLYQLSQIFLYPSHYEGFGIPVLEALACGVPVITSKVSCLPEAGGPASSLVDPNCPDEIASQIEAILTSTELRNKMILAGKEHAQRFDAERVTCELMQVYESLVG